MANTSLYIMSFFRLFFVGVFFLNLNYFKLLIILYNFVCTNISVFVLFVCEDFRYIACIICWFVCIVLFLHILVAK